ncbi:BON domain-containing protein [Rhodoferax ferrireducens]|uniref:BON domain-containing protein n=1 Tax=Rhodoferax ferrireducens TaxID=192843 RepID=UPI000E0CE7B9|nr:BON domain-containing protein [Rhodoferax ferrireducens]
MKFATQKLVTMLALSACVGVGLGACAPIMVGGAVMSSLVATDRRTAGTQLEDEGIELRAASGVRANLGDRARVNFTSYNRQVLLTGEVANAQDKQLVEQVVSRVENVRAVVNELGIQDSPSFTQRSSDALVTGMVKANMVDAKDLFANSFKVTTERGITYLMGRVTQREANRATDIARGTKGVQKVVRVLEIISEEELQGMQSKPASAEAK